MPTDLGADLRECGAVLDAQARLRTLYGSEWGQAFLCAIDTQVAAEHPDAPALLHNGLFLALHWGDPYYWGRALCPMLPPVAARLPDWTLTPAGLPSYCGLLWFATPLLLPGHGTLGAVYGYAWSSGFGAADGADVLAPGIINAPGRTPESILLCVFQDDPELRDRPVPGTSVVWVMGQSLDAICAARARDAVPRTGWSDDDAARYRAKLAIWATAMQFCQQQVVVPTPTPAPRGVRRRLERAGWPHVPDVQVVCLRRRVRPGAPAAPAVPVDWSCQWLVRGHWRQQYYPSLARHQPLWVLPYVKGPDDKPLKPPSTKLFAVVR